MEYQNIKLSPHLSNSINIRHNFLYLLVVLIIDPYGSQILLPHLLDGLQVVVAVVDELVRILPDMEEVEPSGDNVGRLPASHHITEDCPRRRPWID